MGIAVVGRRGGEKIETTVLEQQLKKELYLCKVVYLMFVQWKIIGLSWIGRYISGYFDT